MLFRSIAENEINAAVQTCDLNKSTTVLIDEITNFFNDKFYSYGYIKRKVMDFYYSKKVEPKLSRILQQLIVSLGRTQWVVLWLGHGGMTKKILMSHFPDEIEEVNNRILDEYRKWKEDEIQKVSEDIINFNY